MAKKSRNKTNLPPAVLDGLNKLRGTAEKIHPASSPVPLSEGSAEIEFKIEGMVIKKKYDNFVFPDFPRASAAVRGLGQVGIIMGMKIYVDLSLPEDQAVLRFGEEIIAVLHLSKKE